MDLSHFRILVSWHLLDFRVWVTETASGEPHEIISSHSTFRLLIEFFENHTRLNLHGFHRWKTVWVVFFFLSPRTTNTKSRFGAFRRSLWSALLKASYLWETSIVSILHKSINCMFFGQDIEQLRILWYWNASQRVKDYFFFLPQVSNWWLCWK